MNTREAIMKRSSARSYTGEQLTDEQLEALIQAGLQAPTATNRQELHFTVVRAGDPLLGKIEEEKNRLRNASPQQNFYYDAPIVIMISAEKGFRWSTLDSGIAVENIALAAEELGLGNVIIGCIYDAMHGEKKAEFEKALRFPDGYEFEIAIAVGRKAAAKEPHTYDKDKQVTCL